MPAADTSSASVLTPQQFLAHWQGHRRLSRRTIEAFPEDQLFTFSIGGMRPFGALANEMVGMVAPTVHGVITDQWDQYTPGAATNKTELLAHWDDATAKLDALFPQIPAARFQATMTAFGQWTMVGYDLLLYCVDNEVHHRGQGFVYLRALGIEPPPFYVRS